MYLTMKYRFFFLSLLLSSFALGQSKTNFEYEIFPYIKTLHHSIEIDTISSNEINNLSFEFTDIDDNPIPFVKVILYTQDSSLNLTSNYLGLIDMYCPFNAALFNASDSIHSEVKSVVMIVENQKVHYRIKMINAPVAKYNYFVKSSHPLTDSDLTEIKTCIEDNSIENKINCEKKFNVLIVEEIIKLRKRKKAER